MLQRNLDWYAVNKLLIALSDVLTEESRNRMYVFVQNTHKNQCDNAGHIAKRVIEFIKAESS